MKCLLIFFICLGLTSALYDAFEKLKSLDLDEIAKTFQIDLTNVHPVLNKVQSLLHGVKLPIVIPNLNTDFQCGIIKGSQDRITGGTEAERNSIPWIAQVVIQQPDFSPTVRQGAIIGPYHILTLGSMFRAGDNYNSVDDITVKLNKLNIDQGVEDGEVHHQVKCLSKFPGYDGMTKDYALLILKERIVSKFATPVCLPAKDSNGNYPTFAGSNMTVSGWGYTVGQGNDLYSSPVLKSAQVQGISHQQCTTDLANSKKYNTKKESMENIRVDNFMLCAKEVNGQACISDLGGPLTFNNGTNHVLAGLASFHLCDENGEPAVYSRVTAVIDWIKQHGLYTGKPVCPN